MMGCELRNLTAREGDDLGREIWFVYNPETDGFVSLSDYADDEIIPWGVVRAWERALDMEPIPKGEA